ncbi:hypothetical protein [Cupriavidus oxalaticus]|nr:hypothetical protein [Cupriavidus oxalaticus]
MIKKYCKGPALWIAIAAVLLLAHSYAVERDLDSEPTQYLRT